MNRLFFPNFHFEHRLADPQLAELPKVVKRIDAELACAWTAIAEQGDGIVVPSDWENGFCESLSAHGLTPPQRFNSIDDVDAAAALCPWGWTNPIRTFAARLGIPVIAPPQETVRNLNSRRFSFKSECDWNVGLEDSAAITNLAELRNTIADLPDNRPWVLKAEFGMSGRERCLQRGHHIDDATTNWAAKRLKRDGVLFFEPWVECLAEAGLQFEIPRTGAPQMLGVTPLISDAGGRYRGSRFDADTSLESEWSEAIETGVRVCEVIQQAGYFGPVGIDAMRYRDGDGRERVRPLQDINARWTMGRLALGFRRLLQPGETGVWHHLDWPTDDATAPQKAYAQFVESLPAGTTAIRTAPFWIDGLPVRHGSAVVISPQE